MRGVVKNSSYLVLAQSVVKVISFFYTLFLAKSLGVDNFGVYIAALAYFSLVTSISDFGISRYLIREVVKGEKDSSLLASHIIFLRLTALSVIFAIFAVFIYLLDPLKIRVVLSLIAVFAVIPQSAALTLDNLFIAFQKMSLSALGILILSVSNTLVGILLISRGQGAVGATLALLISEGVYAAFLYLLFRKEKIKLTVSLRLNLLKEILIGSLPYGVLGILGLIYFRVDSLFLTYMKGSFDTGIYGIAYKFLEASVFIPTAVGTAFFPILTKLHFENKEEVKKAVFKIFKSMSILGIAVLLGYILILPWIIRFFLPQYLSAIIALEILSLSIPFMYIHVPLSQVLLSSDKYLKGVIFLSVINVLFNVVLNLIFIPNFGYIGASWVTVASDVFSVVILTFFIRRYLFRNG